MKAIKIAGHPVVVITVFLLALISGEGFGGPYILYLILGLPHGVGYSLAGILGLICLFLSFKIYRREKKHWIKACIALAGLSFLILSMYMFFTNDKMRYNYNTFNQTVPVITLLLLALCIACNFIINIIYLKNLFSKQSSVDSFRPA